MTKINNHPVCNEELDPFIVEEARFGESKERANMSPAEFTVKPLRLFTLPFLSNLHSPNRGVALGNNPFHIGQVYKKPFAIHLKYGFLKLL